MKWLLSGILFFLFFGTEAQVTINITAVPVNTPVTDNIFIAGTINGWDPGAANFQLTKISATNYTITLASGTGTIEFKFTRGIWDKGECKSDGSFLPNRTFTYGNGETINLTVEGWDDLINGGGSTSTALPNVTVMNAAFFMPQLNRSRKIWLYLPDDYTTSLNKFYPVIYMQDGQNVFDDSTSFSGEWEVDETLHQLQMDGNYGAIVIAIENGGTYRLDEYSPYMNPSYGGGQGDEYCDFIVNTLKPYVDANYRTLSQRDYTAIAGSSMGGLISFYAALKYPDVFSKIGVFSPSLWFDDSIFTYAGSHPKTQEMKFYFTAGRNESAEMVPDIKSMYATLYADGYTDVEMDTVIKEDGQHAEWFWAREFPYCFQWLFNGTIIHAEDPEADSIFTINPNPARDKIYLQSKYPLKKIRLQVFDIRGQKLMDKTQPFSKEIDISKLINGSYYLKVSDEQKEYSKILQIMK
ncbi:MAG: T9SS type A sorting domain-containing protein [Chitinophagaceae bacterium]|nr:T9SS type A sorting domain-containing protein [Chitinophagaceae bacterium]